MSLGVCLPFPWALVISNYDMTCCLCVSLFRRTYYYVVLLDVGCLLSCATLGLLRLLKIVNPRPRGRLLGDVSRIIFFTGPYCHFIPCLYSSRL
jgi:hypothetical protein